MFHASGLEHVVPADSYDQKKNNNTQNAACFFQHHKDLETFYSPRVQLQTHSETVFGLGFFLGINAAAIEGIWNILSLNSGSNSGALSVKVGL